MLILKPEDPYHRRAGNILCGRLCKIGLVVIPVLLIFYVASLPDAGLTAPYMATWLLHGMGAAHLEPS
jgi:hypothetical protein